MCESLEKTAQFTMTREIEIEAVLEYIRQRKKTGQSVKFMHVLIKVVASILKEHERLNASVTEELIIYHGAVNMGIAVALPDGLLVPVLKNVDTSSLDEIARDYDLVIPKAQTGKLSHAEMSEGTFTISNLGMAGIDAFTPVVNYPESAVLGVGRINDRVVLNDNNFPERRKAIIFSLTVDHRIIDGYTGALFLTSLADTLINMGKLRATLETV